MYLSDTISILLPPGHCLYEPIPGYVLSITFGNSHSTNSHSGAHNLKKKSQSLNSAIETNFNILFIFYRTTIISYIKFLGLVAWNY